MAKPKNLKDIKIKEVSLVDLPANKLPFLFYKQKGTIMDEKTLKALQKYLGTEDIDFEKKVDEEEIQKAVTLITEHYKESFPEDLENAVGVIAKCAANSYAVKDNKDVEKAGARLSKDMIKKLQAIIEALKGLMPTDNQSSETKKSDTSEGSELSKQLTMLTEAIAKLSPEKKDNDKSGTAELTKKLQEVAESVKALEKGGAVKKSISGDDDNDISKSSNDSTTQWPSLTRQNESD